MLEMMAIQVMEMDEVTIKCGDESIKIAIFKFYNFEKAININLILFDPKF